MREADVDATKMDAALLTFLPPSCYHTTFIIPGRTLHPATKKQVQQPFTLHRRRSITMNRIYPSSGDPLDHPNAKWKLESHGSPSIGKRPERHRWNAGSKSTPRRPVVATANAHCTAVTDLAANKTSTSFPTVQLLSSRLLLIGKFH